MQHIVYIWFYVINSNLQLWACIQYGKRDAGSPKLTWTFERLDANLHLFGIQIKTSQQPIQSICISGLKKSWSVDAKTHSVHMLRHAEGVLKCRYSLIEFLFPISICLQTYIGSILAAVNPYQSLSDLYDATAIERYSRHHLGEIPPHIYAITNECYRSLWKRSNNQCVLIRYVSVLRWT